MIELITIDELAKISGKSKFELALVVAEGKIPHVMKDGMPRFDLTEIIRHELQNDERTCADPNANNL
jgi:hypothetical protein